MTQTLPTQPAPKGPGSTSKQNAGRGLGVAALVVAVVALLLCWVPIVNNFAAILGVVGLGLGIASLIVAAKNRAGKGLGIASSIIAIVAIVMVFVTQAAYVSAIDDVVESIEDSADGEVEAPAEVVEQAEDAAQVLPLGHKAEIGEYEVSINDINFDAAEDIAQANEFNEKAEGQFVLAEVAVKYLGQEEGDPWIDLNIELVGSDARIYSTTTAMVVPENPASDVPTLTNGGSGTYQEVFDVPAEALDGATIRVTETLSFDDASAMWGAK